MDVSAQYMKVGSRQRRHWEVSSIKTNVVEVSLVAGQEKSQTSKVPVAGGFRFLCRSESGTLVDSMCGRVYETYAVEDLSSRYNAEAPSDLSPSWNLCPTENSPVLRIVRGKRQIQ